MERWSQGSALALAQGGLMNFTLIKCAVPAASSPAPHTLQKPVVVTSLHPAQQSHRVLIEET